MDKRNKLIYGCLFVILFSVMLFFTIKLFPIYKIIGLVLLKLFLPFIIAGLISYLLYPVIVKIQTYKVNKSIAIISIYLVFFGSIFLLVYYGFPIFVKQLGELSEQLPQMIVMYEEIIYSIYESTSFLPEVVHDKLNEFIIRIEKTLESQISLILAKLENIFDLVLVLTIIPVLVFYFLKDYEKLHAALLKIVPVKHRQKTNVVLQAVDTSLGNYLRGQFLICMVIIFLTIIVYDLLDLKYALVLAIFMGVMNIIPYFGPIIGTAPAVLLAMTISWKTVIIVLITTIFIQILEGSFLSPYVMGRSVHMHPIMIIFVLLVGAEVGGILGMVIAIPTVTIARTIIKQLLSKKTNRIDI